MAVADKPTSRPAALQPASLAPAGRNGVAGAIRVVLVDSDLAYRGALAAELIRRDLAVRGFDDGAALLSTPDVLGDADIIVASWGTHGMSGLELSIRLRRQGIDIPVVLLAGRALAGRESLMVDADTGRIVARTRSAEALAGHLREIARSAAKSVPP